MRRIKQQWFPTSFCVVFVLTACSASPSLAAVQTWNGTGDWANPSFWSPGPTPVLDGTDDAIINSGTATYTGFLGGGGAGDFEIGSGSDLTINSGGTWEYPLGSNSWSNINGSLTLDGGAFSRTGGGVLYLGGANAVAGQATNISISAGGLLEHRGEVWVGNWENTADNVTVAITVDGGTLDLSPAIDPVTLLPFANPSIFIIDPSNDPTWGGTTALDFSINFTGSTGTMRVGADGMVMPTYNTADDPLNPGNPIGYEWNAMSYQEMWDLGLLQANGQSGLTSAVMTDFFTVTGSSGAADYTLTVGATPGVIGDYNGNGTVDAADYTVWRDGNSPDNSVAGYDTWVANFGNTASVATSVPEPSTALMLLLCTVSFAVRRSGR